jgi:hypothetical protein
MAIIQLVQKNKHIKLAGNEKLRIERELKEPKDRAQMVRDVLRSLGQPGKTGWQSLFAEADKQKAAWDEFPLTEDMHKDLPPDTPRESL